jgi:hypothetical protein
LVNKSTAEDIFLKSAASRATTSPTLHAARKCGYKIYKILHLRRLKAMMLLTSTPFKVADDVLLKSIGKLNPFLVELE